MDILHATNFILHQKSHRVIHTWSFKFVLDNQLFGADFNPLRWG